METIYVAIDVESNNKICFMSKDLDKLKQYVVDYVNKFCELDEGGPVTNFDTDYYRF